MVLRTTTLLVLATLGSCKGKAPDPATTAGGSNVTTAPASTPPPPPSDADAEFKSTENCTTCPFGMRTNFEDRPESIEAFIVPRTAEAPARLYFYIHEPDRERALSYEEDAELEPGHPYLVGQRYEKRPFVSRTTLVPGIGRPEQATLTIEAMPSAPGERLKFELVSVSTENNPQGEPYRFDAKIDIVPTFCDPLSRCVVRTKIEQRDRKCVALDGAPRWRAILATQFDRAALADLGWDEVPAECPKLCGDGMRLPTLEEMRSLEWSKPFHETTKINVDVYTYFWIKSKSFVQTWIDSSITRNLGSDGIAPPVVDPKRLQPDFASAFIGHALCVAGT